MNKENAAWRSEMSQLRQSIDKKREIDRKKIDKLERKIENKYKLQEKKIEKIKNVRKYEKVKKKVNVKVQ